MANPDNPYGFEPYRLDSGGSFPIDYGYADTVTAITAGDAIVRKTTGYIGVAGTTSTSILGIAAKTISSVAGTYQKIPFYPALEAITFVGQTDGTAAISDVGESCSITGTTGIMEIDMDDNDPGVLRITGLKPGSAWGANAELLFKIQKSAYTGQA